MRASSMTGSLDRGKSRRMGLNRGEGLLPCTHGRDALSVMVAVSVRTEGSFAHVLHSMLQDAA